MSIAETRALMGALPLIAQALGNKYGLKVVIGGSRAMTDGKTIYLPSLPIDSPDLADMISGYLDHEAGHVRETDFSVRCNETPLHGFLMNVLEDVRIEKAMGELYPGCRTNLARLIKKLVRKGDFALVDDTDPVKLVPLHLLYKLRQKVLGQTGLNELAQDAREKMDRRYPGLADELDAVTQHVASAVSTADCARITWEVVEAMKKYIETPPPPPSPSPESEDPEEEMDGGEQSESSSASGEGEGEGSDSSSNSGDDSSSDSSGKSFNNSEGQNTEGADASSSSSGSQASGEGGADLVDESFDRKTLQSVLDAVKEDLPEGLGEMLAEAIEEDVESYGDCYERCGDIGPSSTDILHIINEAPVRASTNALRARLAGLLQAKQQVRCLPARRGRRLDNRSIVRVQAGVEQRAFRGRSERQGVNTAVHILLDRSGSMYGEEIRLANDCLLAVKIASESLRGVNLGISAFPASDAGGYVPVLRHGETLKGSKVGLSADGGTPLTEALWGVAVQMQPLEEDRKVVIVLTDGQPHNGPAVHASIRKLEQLGYEFVGIGIQDTSVANYFRNYAVVHALADLPTALFGQLQKLLV